MPYKFFCVSFILILTICTEMYADTLKLEGFGEKIDVKILEMTEEFIKVVVPQREIGSISIKSEHDDKYPDTVFINVDGKESKVICKIVKISKKPGSITLQIPRERVAAIQIAFPGNEQDTDSNKSDALTERSRESMPPPVDAEKLKEQIKEELRLEFERKQGKDDIAIEEKIKEELRLELEDKKQMEEDAFEVENYGKVAGRMLFKGKPLPGCQVKIIMLEKWGIFGKPKESLQFETITDDNGRYLFEKVHPGGYKIYWKPPGESSWIRSIKMEPDIFVEAGETYHFHDRDTNIKTVN
ncbi:MAG: carboxypeptidase-like regulatory domain-containing protein [Planctomycetota bacterium]